MSQFKPTFGYDLRVSIGIRLRALRLQAGLSQQRVAELAGSHRPIIARMEKGHHVPTLQGAICFAEICGGSWRDVTEVLDEVIMAHAAAWPKPRVSAIARRLGVADATPLPRHFEM
jgi:transcriptional regulator with XRE-family HTH domain